MQIKYLLNLQDLTLGIINLMLQLIINSGSPKVMTGQWRNG